MIFGAGACDTGAGGYMALELDELAVVDITGTGAGAGGIHGTGAG